MRRSKDSKDLLCRDVLCSPQTRRNAWAVINTKPGSGRRWGVTRQIDCEQSLSIYNIHYASKCQAADIDDCGRFYHDYRYSLWRWFEDK